MYAGVLRAEGVLVTSAASTDQIAFSQRQTDGTWAARQITVANLITGGGTGLTAGSVPFANSSGDLTQDNANFSYNATNHALTATNVNLGGASVAGTLAIYSSTASTGHLAIINGSSSGNFTTTISLASQAAAHTYTVPDAGASCNFMLTAGAQTATGALTLSGGSLSVGSTSNAATITLFPGTTNGTTSLTMSANTGNTLTNINVAAQAGARTYTVPDAGASSSFMMTAGAQTATGALTLSGGSLSVGSTSNAATVTLFPGTANGTTSLTMTANSGNTLTNMNFAAQAGARTYTVPDAGASASFVMTQGAQTLAGVKTFSSVPIGTQYVVQVYLPTITALAGQVTVLHSCMFSGTVTFISATVDAAFTTSNIVITPSIYSSGSGTAITGGAVTINYSGSGAGTTASATPSAANTFVAGNAIMATVTGGVGSVNGVVAMLITRTA